MKYVNKKYKVLDLFAGAGGMSLGLEMSGLEIVGAIESDRWACDTFASNHPNSIVVQKNIELISDEEVKKTFGNKGIDIIAGGPPCQGFSICKKDAGDPKDPRNSLFEEFIRFGRIIQPSIMIMENVPNLLKAKTSNGSFVIDIIQDELSKLGFYVYHNVLQATDYGVPQIRKRLFVIASKFEFKNPFPRKTHYIDNDISNNLLDSGLKKCPTLWDAISDLPQIQAREGKEEMSYSSPPKNSYQEFLRKESRILYNHKAMNHSKRMVERFSVMKFGDSVSDVPDYLKPIKRNSNTVSNKVYDQNNRRLHPDKPSHTVPASFYANFVHPYLNRNFTAREGARIQSFPDSYLFKGKPTVVSHKLLAREGREEEKFLCQYNQIGNAVPPLMAKSIAENLLFELEDINNLQLEIKKYACSR